LIEQTSLTPTSGTSTSGTSTSGTSTSGTSTSGTSTSGTTKQKTYMYGTPEERAARKAKGDAALKAMQERYIMSAFRAGYFEYIDDGEFNLNCGKDTSDFAYRELIDGKKIKINLKKYDRYRNRQDRKPDAPLPGLYTSRDYKNAEKPDNRNRPSILTMLNPFKERNGCIYTKEDKSGVKK
jgi:hypothetical protein